MTSADLPTVIDIAAVVHPSLPEDTAIFAERLKLYSDGCYVFERRHVIEGYVVSHSWAGEPPALNKLLGKLPAAPTTYYFHDIALLPAARGGGAASDIVVRLAVHARAQGFATVSLVAVGGSAGFWQKHDFAVVEGSAPAAKLASYGGGARLMMRPLTEA